ncbi:MAG: hypothetical protein KAS30_03330, partial [Candidatus Diapherotrites archaeon]|nr:hypothetical protein [Candidatus Diapherotrites archaeon]
MKRGQLFSIDLVIAFFMMIVGISFILIYYEDIAYSIDHKLEMQKMQRIADDAAHLMMNHPEFLNDFDASGMNFDEEKIGTIDYNNTSFKTQGDFDTGYVFSATHHEIGAQGYTLEIKTNSTNLTTCTPTLKSNIAKSQRILHNGISLEVYV